MTQRTYLAIGLKSYYASAECVARHLDPLTTNLVVADASRTEKTICLAVSPSLKSYGIPGRARLFEVVQRVKEVNNGRLRDAIRNKTAVYKDGVPSLAAAPYDATALAADSSLEVSYLVAPPRMAYYEKVSRQIYGIYLKYIAPEDIVVYSIRQTPAGQKRHEGRCAVLCEGRRKYRQVHKSDWHSCYDRPSLSRTESHAGQQ